MVKTAQNEIRLKTQFVILFGFIPNSGVVRSRWHGTQTELIRCEEQRGREETDYKQRNPAPT
jgi:hypothetical protein